MHIHIQALYAWHFCWSNSDCLISLWRIFATVCFFSSWFSNRFSVNVLLRQPRKSRKSQKCVCSCCCLVSWTSNIHRRYRPTITYFHCCFGDQQKTKQNNSCTEFDMHYSSTWQKNFHRKTYIRTQLSWFQHRKCKLFDQKAPYSWDVTKSRCETKTRLNKNQTLTTRST